MNSRENKAIQVLKAWHRVEFFQAYSVDVNEGNEGSQSNPMPSVRILTDKLSADGDTILPWITPQAIPPQGFNKKKEITYTLSLGLFDKAVLTKIVEKKGESLPSSKISKDEIEQRLKSEGQTCFAKLKLDKDGYPQFDDVSVSTLPWAIGKLLKDRVADMSFAKYSKDSDELIERLSSIDLPLKSLSGKGVLDTKAIHELMKMLYEWAGVTRDNMATHEASAPLFQIDFFQKEHTKKTNDDAEDSQLPIFNSFYINDIELAINCIKKGTAGEGLLRYLGDVGERNTDLYTDKALALIADHLHPANTPEGRWPSDPAHNMSLMQQFAVNTSLKELQDDGIISVNGPPGTGKTTLLRDIIAQNIVKRAKVLVGFSHAKDGLTKNGLLDESLTGFEMVVASTNNAAVENISKELPQVKSLATEYRSCRYFQPVANQMCAEKEKGKLKPINEPGELAWGTIAAVMGAKSKRNKFATRFFFYDHWNKKPPTERDEASNFLMLSQFTEKYTGPSFAEAKEQLTTALSNFKSENTKREEYEALDQSCSQKAYEGQLEEIKREISSLEKAESKINVDIENDIKRMDYLLSIAELDFEKERLNKPWFIARFFNFPSNQRHNKELKRKQDLVESQRRAINKDRSSVPCDLQQNNLRQSELINQKKKLMPEWKRKQEKLNSLKKDWESYRPPSNNLHISDPELQRDAFWQNKLINDLRSKVFISAMQLHEAWLMELLTSNALTKNKVKGISKTIQGKKTETAALALWQIFFMFVPVISTTFASLGRMFAHIPENSLGWLMIDEAGQALPQAAVGGLMRARRTIVVGDPLQIEPVFTAPPRLIEHLMSSLLGEEQKEWNPCSWSVQQLADRVNPYGCMLDVMGEDKWIGIPLWVHRRCIVSAQASPSNKHLN